MVTVLKNEDITEETPVIDEVTIEQTVGVDENKEVWTKITIKVSHFKELLLTWLFPVSYDPWNLIDSFEEYRKENNVDYKRKDAA